MLDFKIFTISIPITSSLLFLLRGNVIVTWLRFWDFRCFRLGSTLNIWSKWATFCYYLKKMKLVKIYISTFLGAAAPQRTFFSRLISLKWQSRMFFHFFCTCTTENNQNKLIFRYLATGCSFGEFSHNYRLGRTTVRTIIRQVCSAIWTKVRHKLAWTYRGGMENNCGNVRETCTIPELYRCCGWKTCKN